MRKEFLKRMICGIIIALLIIPLNIAGDPSDAIDLSIRIDGYTPLNPAENNDVKINIHITYQGTTTLENLPVQLSCDAKDTIVDYVNITMLIPGESTDMTMNWEAAPGNHTLIAFVDPQNKLQETDETNNIDQIKIQVKGNPEKPSPEVRLVTYGDNVKYEHLSTGVIRETIPFPTVYDAENGQWIPANLNLSWDESRSVWHPEKSRANISLKNTIDSSGIFRFEMNSCWIEYLLNEGKMTWISPKDNTENTISSVLEPKITTNTNTLTYQNIFYTVDLSYTVLPFGLKECFILTAPPPAADVSTTAVLALKGTINYDHNLTIWADGTECTKKSFQTKNTIEFRRTGEPNPVFWLSPPFACDSNRKNTSYIPCSYAIFLTNGTVIFSVEISSAWLLSSDRVYPIMIDPTIVTKYPVGDTFVRSYTPSTVYGSSTEFTVNPRTADICRTYLKFDLSSIPAGSTIASATLGYYYYRYWEADPAGRTNELHKVNGSWTEGTLCWNNKPAYNPTTFASYIVPSSRPWWITIDIRQYIQDKVNGETDYGILVKDQTEQDMSLNTNPCMYSKEYGYNSPELLIEYTPPGNYYTWREGESWERSYSTPTGGVWNILSDTTASNGKYTRQLSDTYSGDWAEWDFTVLSQGTYYFWVRGRYYTWASSSVRLLWSGNQIGSDQNWWQSTAEWKWTCFGSRWLSAGSGTLRITNPSSSYWIWADNIVITNNVSYVPTGKGFEGSTDHTIGGTAYAEDFENDLGREWSFYYDNPDYAQNRRSNAYSHSGMYCWSMDIFSGYGFYYNLNEMILHVKLSGASYLNLSFYTQEFNDEQNIMPASFMGHNKSDGIAVSTDRTNWIKLWQYRDSIPSWTPYTSLNIGKNISLSGDVYIKFQQYDNDMISSDGILWDDIYLDSDGVINIDPKFILPPKGGAMVHSDPHLSDFINMSVPKNLGDEWSTYRSSTTYGKNNRSELDMSPGDECWSMDVNTNNHYNLNELTLHVKISGATYLNLNFKTKEYYDEQNNMPSSFTGHSNSDGVAVSSNNNTWYQVWKYPSSAQSWTQPGPFNLANNISISGDVYIKFQQYDDRSIGGLLGDGIVWDNISLVSNGKITYGSGRNTSSYLEDFNMAAWIKKELLSEQSQNAGNGIAGNGEIAACPFACLLNENNLVIYDYNGNRVWKSASLLRPSTTSSTPIVSIDNKVIACDNYKVIMVDPYYNDDGKCLWSTEIPGGPIGFILSPAITENGVIILPAALGNIYAFNSDNGVFLGSYPLGGSYTVMNTSNFTTSNSACVNGNRAYILGQKSNANSRLFTIDINPSGNIFTPVWNCSYPGKSQSSPTFINNVIYFDFYQNILQPTVNVGVHAVQDTGSTSTSYHWNWNKTLAHMTWFAMTVDPRGDSIWFEDTYNRNLTRLSLSNGAIIENISIEKRMGSGYRPISCMQICGKTNPMMIVSANNPLVACYVICIDLEYNYNPVIWSNRIKSTFNCNYAGGQFTILLDNAGNNPRIVFGAYWGGVYAFGH